MKKYLIVLIMLFAVNLYAQYGMSYGSTGEPVKIEELQTAFSLSVWYLDDYRETLYYNYPTPIEKLQQMTERYEQKTLDFEYIRDVYFRFTYYGVEE